MRMFAWSTGCFLLLASAILAGEDVIDKMPGLDQPNAPLVGQGRNLSRDRGMAFWAQLDANETRLLDKPNGKRWMTVDEAIPWAKRVWNVNILDETDDPEVGKVRFATGFGAVEREFALPLFLEALSMAIEGAKPDCYVERDLPGGRQWNTADYARGIVHIRRARPLQPEYDLPTHPDRAAVNQLEASMENLPALSDHYCAPSGTRGQRCSECQAKVAATIADAVAKGGVAAANTPACYQKIAEVCKECPHCAAYWESRERPNYQPIVIVGTGGPADRSAEPEKK